MSNPFRNWTPADAERHNARVKHRTQIAGGARIDHFTDGTSQILYPAAEPGTENSVLRPADLAEKDLHNRILEQCKKEGWLAFHGSTAHRTRRTVGEVDFYCLLPNGIVMFIECKVANRKLSVPQQATIAHMEKLGHRVWIIRSLSEFLEASSSLLKARTSAV